MTPLRLFSRFTGTAFVAVAAMLFAPRGAGTEVACPGGTSTNPDILFCDDFDGHVDGPVRTGLPGWAAAWIQTGEIAIDPAVRLGATGKSLRFRYRIPSTLAEHQDDNTSLIQQLTPTRRCLCAWLHLRAGRDADVRGRSAAHARQRVVAPRDVR